jgi:hypothetical protein
VNLRRVVLIAGVLAVAAGCNRSPYDLAPVSGLVTLDGNPLAAARVRFEPRAAGDSIDAGPGSMGITDSEGRYELETIKQNRGAVVGTHVVRIGTRQTRLDPNNLDRLEVLAKEVVPMRYNTSTRLTFEVPSGGTEEANFDLSGKGRKAN